MPSADPSVMDTQANVFSEKLREHNFRNVMMRGLSPNNLSKKTLTSSQLEGREPPLTLRQEKQCLYFGHLFPCSPGPFSL